MSYVAKESSMTVGEKCNSVDNQAHKQCSNKQYCLNVYDYYNFSPLNNVKTIIQIERAVAIKAITTINPIQAVAIKAITSNNLVTQFHV
eukprot:scaffold2053_cov112-Cylindrotheca_fusiformis.AAC.3